MKRSLLLLAVSATVLATGRPAWAGYDPAETAIQNIIPLFEYRQLVYAQKRTLGTEPGPARDQSRVEAWNEDSDAIRDDVYPLTAAKIVLVNYKLLKKDFPFLADKAEDVIDKWVLDNAAFIAKSQVDAYDAAKPEERVNSAIPHGAVAGRKAYRPWAYGRALLFKVSDDKGAVTATPTRFIDVKGAGARRPYNQEGGHSNGLMSLGECIREYTYESLINQLLSHANREHIAVDGYSPKANPTVGSYACIYTGFSIAPGDAPAALYLRQAHTRFNLPEIDMLTGEWLMPERDLPQGAKDSTGAGHMPHVTKIKIAKILALYNVWADEWATVGDDRFRHADIQGTQDGRLFDFGAYLGGANPDKTTWGRAGIANQDKARTVPFEQWGWDTWRDPGKDWPWNWAHDNARAIANYLRESPTGVLYRQWAGTHYDAVVKNLLSADPMKIWAEPIP